MLDRDMLEDDGGNRIVLIQKVPGHYSGLMGIHSRRPMWNGQSPGPCEALQGGECYTDTSVKGGIDVARMWGKGQPGAWAEMEKWYREWFGQEGTEDHD